MSDLDLYKRLAQLENEQYERNQTERTEREAQIAQTEQEKRDARELYSLKLQAATQGLERDLAAYHAHDLPANSEAVRSFIEALKSGVVAFKRVEAYPDLIPLSELAQAVDKTIGQCNRAIEIAIGNFQRSLPAFQPDPTLPEYMNNEQSYAYSRLAYGAKARFTPPIDAFKALTDCITAPGLPPIHKRIFQGIAYSLTGEMIDMVVNLPYKPKF